MKNLQEIKDLYPAALKAKPKGWQFIYGETVIKPDDKIWINDKFHKVENSAWESIIGERAFYKKPIIREIKAAPKQPKIPDGLTIPSGHVYIGNGGLECHPSWSYSNTAPPLKLFCHLRFIYGNWEEHEGWTNSYPVIALIDSDLHKAQPWYRPKNTKDLLADANNKIEELNKELAKQKDELEKYKAFYNKVKGIEL